MAKAKKRRSPSDMARLEFRKKHGRWPAKGELAGKRKSRSSTTRSSSTRSSSTSKDAETAKRQRAARKAAKTRAKFSYKAKKFVKDHPIATSLVTLAGGAAAHPPTRQYVAQKTGAGMMAVKAFVAPRRP